MAGCPEFMGHEAWEAGGLWGGRSQPGGTRIAAQKGRSDGIDAASAHAFQSVFKVLTKI